MFHKVNRQKFFKNEKNKNVSCYKDVLSFSNCTKKLCFYLKYILDIYILEYGSVRWDHQYAVHCYKIESVQIQFQLSCLRRLGNG